MTGSRTPGGDLPLHNGRYEYHQPLDCGGSGCVYQAWDRQLLRDVAIKRIPLLDAQRALQEARSAAQLRHPAFVTVYEVFESADHACIVMELVRGHSLRTVIEAGTTPSQTCAWMAQCAEALAEAHGHGIAHGDVKPGNLMIDDNEAVRILDFGIACAIDAQRTSTHPEPAAGTLRYMAPELLLGESPCAATDIYALGLVLHELLNRAPVFAAHSGLALAHHKLHASENLPPLPNVSSALQALIWAMTHRDPLQRPVSMLAVRDVLLAPASTVEPTAASCPNQRSRTRLCLARLSWRQRWAAVLLLFAMIVSWQAYAHLSVSAGSNLWTWRQLQAAQSLLRDYDETDNLERAIAALQEILTHHPEHAAAAAALTLAYCMFNGGDSNDATWLKRAEISAQLALRTDDQLALSHVAWAWFLERVGRLPEAEASYHRALQLDPHEFHGLWGLARLLIRMNRPTETREVLRTAMDVYPGEATFHNTLGALLYQQANYRAAEHEFRRSIALEPDSPFGYANLNATLLRQERTDEALTILQEGLKIHSNGVLYNNLGNALFARGRYLEAAAAFERALSNSKGDPNDYLKWANLADALRWIPGKQAESRKAYARALQLLVPQLQPGVASDAMRLSRASLYAAKLDQAARSRAWMSAALARAAEVPDVLFRAAIAAELLGDRPVALQRLKHALARGFPAHLMEQEPDLQALRRELAYYQLLTEDQR